MSIWNKVLLGLILGLALPAFFYMSARMLKIQKYWGELAGKFETKINALQKEDEANIVEIEKVRAELANLTIDRQRVWYNCERKVNPNRQTNTVIFEVTLDQPSSTLIANKSILYVFESAPVAQKGRYLGEFKVTAVADKQITLEPMFKLNQIDFDKLAGAKSPLTLYDSLPHDNHEIFARLADNDKKAMLPADSVGEYLGDKQTERPLRSYAFLFEKYHLKITELIDQIEAADRDLKMVDATLADAKKQVQFYEKETTIVAALKEKITRQRDVVNDYLNRLKDKFDEVKTAVANLIKNNKAMAGQIAKIQLDATRSIDERTRAMAQSANGEN